MDAPYSRRRRIARIASCCAAALLVTAGCTSKPVLVPDPTAAGPGPTTSSLTATMPGTLAWDFVHELQPALKGKVALAIMPVGSDRVVALGDWSGGPAWSSIKVPLTLAALRANPGYTGAATSAITNSDNSAAEMLWQSLGTPEEAAQAVQDVLHEGGDNNTKVPAQRTRSDYSAFGQAEWSIADQLTFAAHLPCLPQAESVTSLMSKIADGQRWGLGTLNNAQFKGGWGPDPSGNYLVRQFGLLPVEGGQVAIAIAALPTSGSFDEGTTMLTKIAGLIDRHLGELRGGAC
ncbi:hypothetical protein GFY24_38160 [Nocardia sp. SYP-A9097]|uniref:hypothetical protein n=1 Tax=Nocardia sp. SYP-A9097 TaxID=2663237 RepID=UPI00129B8482|nr:hypothetical protein [Nocardia sp. SYP-A9097]MRH93179.1 hypothetical protein [Nocardia sp. SYP-A9097]